MWKFMIQLVSPLSPHRLHLGSCKKVHLNFLKLIRVAIASIFQLLVKDVFRVECWTKEEKAILWFCKSTKGDNLACLGWHHGFYITLLSTATAICILQFSQIQFAWGCFHQHKYVLRQDMRKVLADKMKVSPVIGVLVTKVTIKVSITTKLWITTATVKLGLGNIL